MVQKFPTQIDKIMRVSLDSKSKVSRNNERFLFDTFFVEGVQDVDETLFLRWLELDDFTRPLKYTRVITTSLVQKTYFSSDT